MRGKGLNVVEFAVRIAGRHAAIDDARRLDLDFLASWMTDGESPQRV
jgi:hypothetical protein